MPFRATAEQQKAIDAAPNLLVSAAAGSGKTAVLVERVMRRLTDPIDPVSADRLLIVTFTNPAAAEMKARLEKRLDQECRAHPQDISLLRQKQLFAGAKICTIDSFCIDLVRENFEQAGVSPDFKISDGFSLRPLDESVLDRVLNDYYEQKDPAFFALLELVGADYDDGDLKDLVLRLYDYSRQMVDPTAWFDRLAALYAAFDSRSVWVDYAFQKACRTAGDMQNVITNTLDILLGDEDQAKRYYEDFALAADKVKQLKQAAETRDWDGVYHLVSTTFLPKFPRTAAGSFESAAAKEARELLNGAFDDLAALFYADQASVAAQLQALSDPVRVLSELLKRFEGELFEEYRRRNIFTFHNTEHLALALLCGEGGERLTDRFDEVMVDEYQDTNDLQDRLFRILSDSGRKLFVVGDVKQSIYGFRGANPTHFIKAKEAALPDADLGNDRTKKIILGANFRSREEICRYINFFFEQIMTPKTGSLPYGEEERLLPAAVYPPPVLPPVGLELVEFKGNQEDSLRCEAKRIAELIRTTMQAGPCIRENENTLRPARYSDFAILLRNSKNKAQPLAKALRECGIPVDLNDEEFAEYKEVAVFLSLLKVIDNPDSDIEWVTVLLSPLFGFTAEQTALIRSQKPEDSFYAALVYAAEKGDRQVENALRTIERFRLLAVTLPLPKLLVKLMGQTDYLNTVSAFEDGERRRGHLLLLVTLAEHYLDEGGGTLSGFIRYVERQSEKGLKSPSGTDSGDRVKIMTIHFSKGLQFPVCIIAGTALSFSRQDLQGDAIYSAEYGVGFSYYDEREGRKLTSLPHAVMRDSKKSRALEEELRLFYVAMTRAEDRLIFTATAAQAETAAAKAAVLLALCGEQADVAFSHTFSYYEWLQLTTLLHPDGRLLRGNENRLTPIPTESHIAVNVTEGDPSPTVAPPPAIQQPDPQLAVSMQENFSYEYPYEPLLSVEAKASVSAIANGAESAKFAFSDRPAFMSRGGLTATQRGTAIHKVMQFIDFDKADDLQQEIARLYEWQYLTEEEMLAADTAKLRAFFESDLFTRIRAAKSVRREMCFLTELPATVVSPELPERFHNETVMVQGAVDLCFVEDDGVVVLDFKTDRVSDPQTLVTAYGGQLAIYALACEKIFNMPVKQKIIYSFALSRVIEVDENNI